jgi:hypothetical protein
MHFMAGHRVIANVHAAGCLLFVASCLLFVGCHVATDGTNATQGVS